MQKLREPATSPGLLWYFPELSFGPKARFEVHFGGVLASACLENIDNPNKVDPNSKYLNDLVRVVM